MASEWAVNKYDLLNNKSHFYENGISEAVLVKPTAEIIKIVPEHTAKSVSKKRCNLSTCKTKLGLIPFECRCSLIFCNEHRIPENHQCTFDHKSFGKSLIEKNNQKVICEKIQKI